MSRFDIAEHSRKAKSLARPVANKDKQRIKSAFPQTQMMQTRLRDNTYMGMKYSFHDFRRMLYMLSDGELQRIFYESAGDAARLSITMVKQRFMSRDPNYSKRNPQNVHESAKQRLKRPSSQKSIYRYVADNLNMQIESQTGIIVGFVGVDPNTPLLGSRGYPLAPIVEGVPRGFAKAPVNTAVMPSISYAPYISKGHIARNFVKLLPRKRQNTEGKKVRGRKPRPLKYPGKVPMMTVDDAKPIPFLDYWAQKTNQLIYQNFMSKAQEQINRGGAEI